MKNKIFTKNVGQKFNEDGSVRFFPGNTIICKIGPAADVYDKLVTARDMLLKMNCADKFTFLPPSSYHMTAIEGVCDQVRKQEYWTKYLSLEAPLDRVDRFFIEKFNEIAKPESFSMQFDYLRYTGGITVRLLPETENDARALRVFRNDVSEKLGLKFPDHDDYGFHISLAYRIYQLNVDEEAELRKASEMVNTYLKNNFGVFHTSSPKLVFFKDMFKFNEERE